MRLQFGRARVENLLPRNKWEGQAASPAEIVDLFLADPWIDEALKEASDRIVLCVKPSRDAMNVKLSQDEMDEPEIEVSTELASPPGIARAKSAGASVLQLYWHQILDAVIPEPAKSPRQEARNEHHRDAFVMSMAESLKSNFYWSFQPASLQQRMLEIAREYNIERFSLSALAPHAGARLGKVSEKQLKMGQMLVRLFEDPDIKAAFDKKKNAKFYRLTAPNYTDNSITLLYLTNYRDRRDKGEFSRFYKEVKISFDALQNHPASVKHKILEVHKQFNRIIQRELRPPDYVPAQQFDVPFDMPILPG